MVAELLLLSALTAGAVEHDFLMAGTRASVSAAAVLPAAPAVEPAATTAKALATSAVGNKRYSDWLENRGQYVPTRRRGLLGLFRRR